MDSLLGEEWLRAVVALLLRLVEAAAALVIFAGALIAFVRILVQLATRGRVAIAEVRLGLGRTVSLGLEFQIASDLLRTAVAPTFEEIGKLAAVAGIRTALNYFLLRELKEEHALPPEAEPKLTEPRP